MAKTINIKGTIINDGDKWIYDLFDEPSCCPSDIHQAFENLADDEEIQVVINSPGGDIFAASEIYDLLASAKNASIKVVYAASAASYIACACKSEIVPTGMFMIHNVSSYASGDYNDMSHSSDVLLTASKAIASAYRLKTGMNEDELISMMDKETWLTAEQAVEKGFIDNVSDYQNNSNARLAASLTGLIPQKIVAELKAKKSRLKAEIELLKLKGDVKND